MCVCVCRSYSWSANVCGRKEWLLFPPGEENNLRDTRGQLPFDLRTSQSCDLAFSVVQEPGEVIFICVCSSAIYGCEKDSFVIFLSSVAGIIKFTIW